jgi:hypothetical protein
MKNWISNLEAKVNELNTVVEKMNVETGVNSARAKERRSLINIVKDPPRHFNTGPL